MKRTGRFPRSLLAVLVALLLAACKGEKPPATEELRPVRTEQVFASAPSRTRTFAGTAKAVEESKLSFRVPGTIQRIPAKVGDRVKSGQLIAELDPKDYQLKVQEAEAALARATAEARNAEANYSRTRALYINKNASRNDLDASRAAYESAEASVRAAGKQVELARLQLSYTSLEASVEGAIAAVNVEVNENVQAGQPIVLLTSGATPEVKVAIPEVYIARIRKGDTVSVTFDALPAKSFAAKVTEVGVAATGTATTFPVTVRLESPDPNLRSGMAANVTFEFSHVDGQPRFIVPLEAVGEDRDGRFVFVLEVDEAGGKGTVRRRPVKIGELSADGLEILEGLEDGELLITAGVRRLEDGLKVKVLQQKEN